MRCSTGQQRPAFRIGGKPIIDKHTSQLSHEKKEPRNRSERRHGESYRYYRTHAQHIAERIILSVLLSR